MTQQTTEAVLAAPVGTVGAVVADVAHWPSFIPGLRSVTETSFERWTFAVGEGRDAREVAVAVARHPGENRVHWRALDGPRYDGEIHWEPVDAERTRVTMHLTADPAGFLAGLADLARGPGAAATLALQRLEAQVLAGTG